MDFQEKNKYSHYSIAYKMEFIHRYASGLTVSELSSESGISPTQIKDWLTRYRRYGIEGFSFNNRIYSADLKVAVVKEIMENHLSLRQASLNYQIERGVLQKWIIKAESGGLEALLRDNRGRPSKNRMSAKVTKTLKPLSKEQSLLIENERLKAENAYLKKLGALVQERIARESGKDVKPSKH